MLYETGKLIKASPLTSQALPEFCTAVVMNVVNEICALSTRNRQQSQFEHADKISGETVAEALQGYKIIMQHGYGCFSIGETLEDA